MHAQRYSVTSYPIDTLLNWFKSEEIAIPEIQRPFVWNATKVRKLLDSLYQGYPVGYLITWRNPTVKLKDGSHSAGKKILIDGQQRGIALMAALHGQEVLTKAYKKVRIRIAFDPTEERFEVSNPAIRKDPKWIGDISPIYSPSASIYKFVNDYCEKNPEISKDVMFDCIEKLRKIINNHVGIIELNEDLDIETVTEIFIRVNSAGVELSQADFAMSKIAVNETYGGNILRKSVDYFCHLASGTDFFLSIEKNDKEFMASEFFPKMGWLKNVNDDIYVPSYTDMLRVAFTSKFRRGRLQDLIALLSGRNFETKEYEEEISERSFASLKKGILNFINEQNFKRIIMILRSAGFITKELIGSMNAVNFAYILYLTGKEAGIEAYKLERLVRRWYVMSILRERYSANPESAFDRDIRQITTRDLEKHVNTVIENELPDTFWTGMLPQKMDTSSPRSPYFLAYKAAQVKLGDKGFLSRDITVRDLLLNKSDTHHVYPREYLKQQGMTKGQYNQIANFVVSQSEINIRIGKTEPEKYFKELVEQCSSGRVKYGGITDLDELRVNFRMNCIPESMLEGVAPSFEEFLEERRHLMAMRIKEWFETL